MQHRGRITIAYVIDFLATREGVTGGTERQLLELITVLDRAKFRPILFCLQEFVRTPLWEAADCEKHVLGVHSLASWKGVAAYLSFIRFLRLNSVDIVQTFFHDSTVFGITAGRAAGVGKTLSCRRDMGFWYDRKSLANLSVVNRLTSRILVNAEAVKETVSRCEGICRDKIDVVLNGIDTQAFEKTPPVMLHREFPGIRPGDPVVGMVANVNREVKRGDLFVRAAGEVVKTHPGVKFLIIGSGRLEGDLRCLIHELGLDAALFLAGKKELVAGYIKAFDVGVLTSDSEGFSNVILEYMAAGVPVVATDVGGNREIVRHGSTGLLVSRGDHLAIARAISSLLEDAGRRDEMGLRAQSHVLSTFAWERKREEITMYYENLLGTP